MKILLLSDRIPPEGRGGAEVVVWRLAQGLANAGHDLYVAASTSGTPFEELRNGIPTFHLHANYPERFRAWLSLWNPQTAGAMRSLLNHLRPDIVNAHNIHSFLTYHALKLAHDAGCGVVFSAHDAMPLVYGKLPAFFGTRDLLSIGDHRLPAGYNLRRNRFRYNPVRNIMIKRALERYAHVRTAPSQALAAAYADNDMPPMKVVHNGIDLAEWQLIDNGRIAEMRQRFDLVDKRVILMAGRLTREKGMYTILYALDSLRDSIPDVRLLLLSARDIDSQISTEFAHLRPWIHLGGWLSGHELRAAYQLANVVAVPSEYVDPFPTVVLEAMAAGTPVVATAFGGAREAVSDGETGYIANPADRVEFTDRLARILKDRDLQRSMGRAGRVRIQNRFQLQHQVRQMLDIYTRALERRSV